MSSCWVGTRLPLQRGLELLVHDALVRRVHVHDHQAGGVLREHIDPRQLRQGEAERRGFARCAPGAVSAALHATEQRVVEALPPRAPAGRSPAGAGPPQTRVASGARRGQWWRRAGIGTDGADPVRAAAPARVPRQQPAQRVEHELVHGLRIAKPHLALGRVDVDVHPRRIDLQEQHEGRMAFVMQHVLEGLRGRRGRSGGRARGGRSRRSTDSRARRGWQSARQRSPSTRTPALVSSRCEQHRRQLVPEQSTDARQRQLGPHAQQGAAVVLQAEGQVRAATSAAR